MPGTVGGRHRAKRRGSRRGDSDVSVSDVRETAMSVRSPHCNSRRWEFYLHGEFYGCGKDNIQTNQWGGRYPKDKFKEWRDKAELQLQAQGIRAEQIDYPLTVTFHYTPGDHRRRDVTAMEDAIFHVLRKAVSKFVKDVFLVSWCDVVSVSSRQTKCGVKCVIEEKNQNYFQGFKTQTG